MKSAALERLQTAPIFHSRALKMASSRKIQRPHFDQSTAYRNQILGIEKILSERLEENDKLYKGSIDRKREIMIDALEDVANSNLGFREQLVRVISTWRKPMTKTAMQTTDEEYERIVEGIKGLRQERKNGEAAVRDLEEEIVDTESEIEDLEREIEATKRRLFKDSDLFAGKRDASDAIERLQSEFDRMFEQGEEEEEFYEFEETVRENNTLRKELRRKQYEFEIASQLNRRLAIITKQRFD